VAHFTGRHLVRNFGVYSATEDRSHSESVSTIRSKINPAQSMEGGKRDQDCERGIGRTMGACFEEFWWTCIAGE
jgi:hypothetical protein